MRALVLLLMLSTMLFASQDPYTMSLDDCRAYIKANHLNWQAGITPYSYLPKEILQGMLPRFYVPISSSAKQAKILLPPNVGNPAALDWTNYNGTNWMTSVKDQASCGSCWAFAVMGVFEAMININSNNPNLDYDLSEQFLVSCNGQGWGCGGGPAGTAPADWVRQNGVPDEACFTYRATNAACNLRCSDWASRLKYFKTVTNVCNTANTSLIKAALVDGPVGTAMQASVMQLRFYKGGNLGDWRSGDTNVDLPLNHGVVIVGYDDARNGGSWHWKNSWGTGWGEAGYGWMVYGAQEMGSYTWKGTAYAEGGGKSITVTYPNGGEQFEGGTKITIKWSSTGSISNVNIYLTTNNSSSWNALATGTSNTGTYDWTVWDINAITCKIRISDTAGTSTDDSDTSFQIYRSTGFKSAVSPIPVRFEMSINPQPVAERTSVNFSLTSGSVVKILAFDLNGRLVATLADSYYSAGSHRINWTPRDLPAGVYHIKLISSNGVLIKRVVHIN